MISIQKILLAGALLVVSSCSYYSHLGGRVVMVVNQGSKVCITSDVPVTVNDTLNVYRTVRESYNTKAQTTRSGHTRLKTGKIQVIEVLDDQHYCAKLTEGTIEEGYTVDIE